MKQRARQLTPTLSPWPLDVPRTRGLRRHIALRQGKPDRRRRRAVRRHTQRHHLVEGLRSLFSSPPPTTTEVNPRRDGKSLRSGRLRREQER